MINSVLSVFVVSICSFPWDYNEFVPPKEHKVLCRHSSYSNYSPSTNHFLFCLKYEFTFSSAAQLCPTLCDPMNRSTPGLPVHHQLPQFTQTHVYWVMSDAIQPSHPLSSPSPPAHNLSQHHDRSFQMSQLFTSGGQSIGVSASASILPMNTQDWSLLGWTG